MLVTTCFQSFSQSFLVPSKSKALLRKSAFAILEHTGLQKFFSQVVTRDCVPNCKPFPDGIHRMDMETAKAAGIKGISICWDGHPSHTAEISDHHFTDVSELHSWATAQLTPSGGVVG